MPSTASTPASTRRLLIVEDDEQVRGLIVQVAEQEGFTVVVAAHGGEALTRLASEHFDVMVTDIYMPETDGIQLIRRAHGFHPAMPIIAISGGGDVAFSPLRAANLLGATHVLSKPFAIAELTRLLQAACAAPGVRNFSSACDSRR